MDRSSSSCVGVAVHADMFVWGTQEAGGLDMFALCTLHQAVSRRLRIGVFHTGCASTRILIYGFSRWCECLGCMQHGERLVPARKARGLLACT